MRRERVINVADDASGHSNIITAEHRPQCIMDAPQPPIASHVAESVLTDRIDIIIKGF